MSETTASTYEELPYSNQAFSTTHPDTLATAATLHGLTPPPLATARVLELGCGRGGNLLPMACQFPDGRFVGIDLSPRQIADGQALATRLNLANIELLPLSILDLDDRFGDFDYIVCHGVYSWVPPEVQDKILAICATRLAANGIAYVSYNTYPGWHLRGMVGAMLRYHVAQFTEPLVKARQARAFLDFLVKTVRVPDSNYGRTLKQEEEVLDDSSDTYLFHEHLESHNAPCYFHEFMARASAHGLQFVAEAEPSPLTGDLPAPARGALDQLARDRVAYEQHLDFLAGGLFRRTLLCRANATVRPQPDATIVPSLRVRARLRPVDAQPEIASPTPVEFRTARGATVTTNNPLAKAAFVLLFEPWPRGLAFNELYTRVRERLTAAPADLDLSREHLARVLLHFHQCSLVELYTREPALVTELSDRPTANPLSRLLAETETLVTNLRHRSVKLDDLDRMVLPLLDGTRDRAAILDALVAAVADGSFEIQHEGQTQAAAQARASLSAVLEECLVGLAENAFLIA